MDPGPSALEVNLAETQRKILEIPGEHLWFLDLSRKYWGIHERTRVFFEEYHHPFPDHAHIIDALRKIAIEDRWLYREIPEAERAASIILSLFTSLLSLRLAEGARRHLLETFGQYVSLIASDSPAGHELRGRVAETLESLVSSRDPLFLECAGFFQPGLEHLSEAESEASPRFLALQRRIAESVIESWEGEPSLTEWVSRNTGLFTEGCVSLAEEIGRGYLSGLRGLLSAPDSEDGSPRRILKRVNHAAITLHFRDSIDSFGTPQDKVYYIIYLLGLSGMNSLKDRLLWDMNSFLGPALKRLGREQRRPFIVNIVGLLDSLSSAHAGTVLDCVLSLGTYVVNMGDDDLIDAFITEVIRVRFVFPGKVEITDEWQIRSDSNHLKNIRVWLALIEKDPPRMRRLLSALIVNLRVGGIFIRDTDLFQRDISALLNSDIGPLYKQIQHLLVLFPVYFKEIGAEGELRTVTTRMDTISGRRDTLIHFLRKQIHVESNNTHIELTRRIILFWHSLDPVVLSGVVPENVVSAIEPEGEWVRIPCEILRKVCKRNRISISELLEMDSGEAARRISRLRDFPAEHLERVVLILRLHTLLEEKYSFDSDDILRPLEASFLFSAAEIRKLQRAISSGNDDLLVTILFGFMRKLKGIILDRQQSEGWENIYHKRHIAAGIPSMYGQYHEKKFEAMGLTFRLERYASRVMERIVSRIELSYVTIKKLRRITEILQFFIEGFELRGIVSQSLGSTIQMLRYSLTSGSFSLEQYINIFQFFMEDIREIITQYFTRTYDEALPIVVSSMLGNPGKEELKIETAKRSEEFYRDLLSSSFLLQTLDEFMGRICLSMRNMQKAFSPATILHVLSYDPDLLISPLDKPTPEMDNKVFLGAKAFFLKKLHSLGIPVPDGFVLTTEVFRHQAVILEHREMGEEIDALVRAEVAKLERKSRRRFGDPDKPLLLSVRSGTAFSMPGAMITFLDVGMTRDVAERMSTIPGYEWAAWDSFRRFLQCWGMAHGIPRDRFDHLMQDTKRTYGVERKIQFSSGQMRELAIRYESLLSAENVRFPEEPLRQLKAAILCVLASWSSARAQAYREHLQIAEDWGTAVIVQRMVFGNLGRQSGTGVVFTGKPGMKTEGVHLYGDYIPGSQGEDVVSGLVHTYPVAMEEAGNGEYREKTMEVRFPKIYARLSEIARELVETHNFPHQEIEFTFESPEPESLFILQARTYNISEEDTTSVFSVPASSMIMVGSGTGIGGGALAGRIAFSMEDIEILSRRYPEERLVLVRPDTVPDDIAMVFRCQGLLTARGGVTSHAAVTASQLGKTCVVNCRDLVVYEHAKECVFGGHRFRMGDPISIDGRLGYVYKGSYPVEIVRTTSGK